MKREPHTVHLPLGNDELRRLILFRGTDLETLRDLLNDCPQVMLERGELLFDVDQENDTLYVVLSGLLRVHLENLNQPCVTHLGIGECVGEMSLIDGERTSACVVANEPTRLLAIRQEMLWSMINGSHAVARNLLYILSGRLRDGNGLISVGHELHTLYEQLSKVDNLTGLHNRRWLDEVLPRLMSRCRVNRHAMALLMLDVDHFKPYNDGHGHLAGDRALHVLGQMLLAHLRPNDMAARYGGEEFVVILPNTDREGAFGVAERLREAAQNLVILNGERRLPGITLSLGVAVMEEGDNAVSILNAADTALYQAKREGRNRVAG